MKWIREVKLRWVAIALTLMINLILIWGGTFFPDSGMHFNAVSTVLLFIPPKRHSKRCLRCRGDDVLVSKDDTKKDTDGGRIPKVSATDSGEDE